MIEMGVPGEGCEVAGRAALPQRMLREARSRLLELPSLPKAFNNPHNPLQSIQLKLTNNTINV
jgi:hypothetical protein